MLDQDGKLYCSPAIRNRFRKYNYEVRCTSTDASNQKGLVERVHQMISNNIRALLFGSRLTAWFWPYVFNHVLHIWNALLHCGQDESPLKMAHNRKDNFKNLKCLVV